jgi:hypothetical protein
MGDSEHKSDQAANKERCECSKKPDADIARMRTGRRNYIQDYQDYAKREHSSNNYYKAASGNNRPKGLMRRIRESSLDAGPAGSFRGAPSNPAPDSDAAMA